MHSHAIADPSELRRGNSQPLRIMDVGASAVQFVKPARHRSLDWIAALDRYVEGWAEADVDKICNATAPGYRFTDPLVGSFSGHLLHAYFEKLQCRFSRAGVMRRQELAFFLRGPMDRLHVRGLRFWREAPLIGLTGMAEIQIGERGVIAERVAYDGNLASDMLRPSVQ
jgi:hypothetical protein